MIFGPLAEYQNGLAGEQNFSGILYNTGQEQLQRSLMLISTGLCRIYLFPIQLDWRRDGIQSMINISFLLYYLTLFVLNIFVTGRGSVLNSCFLQGFCLSLGN